MRRNDRRSRSAGGLLDRFLDRFGHDLLHDLVRTRAIGKRIRAVRRLYGNVTRNRDRFHRLCGHCKNHSGNRRILLRCLFLRDGLLYGIGIGILIEGGKRLVHRLLGGLVGLLTDRRIGGKRACARVGSRFGILLLLLCGRVRKEIVAHKAADHQKHQKHHGKEGRQSCKG